VFSFKNDKNYLIKNVIKKQFEKDLAINPINTLIFISFALIGFVMFFMNNKVNLKDFVILVCFPYIFMLIIIFLPRWEAIIKFCFLTIFVLFWFNGVSSLYYSIFICIGALISPMIQIAKEWERAIVLRFGKFRKVKGPGPFILIPFIDSVTKIVDLRIRVTDFVAETTLTKDSVTVTVDALCFWLVWDAEKAILEVENYIEAVVLSSQTALRNAISMNTLSVLLEQGDNIEEIVRKEVDKKTTEWGITISHIEITDIQIPKELQDSMSRLAQAEREKNAKIEIAEAEIEVAKKLSEASKYYKDNEIAMKLKSLSVLSEGLKNGNSTLILPTNIVEKIDGSDVFGLNAVTEVSKLKRDQKSVEDKN